MYFLFLYQFLKYFPGRTEIIGALIIPGIVDRESFFMPFIGRSKSGHRFNVGFLSCLFRGRSLFSFTWRTRPMRTTQIIRPAVQDAQHAAARVKELTHSPGGIPASGALTLLRNDPLTQGPKLFAKNCASCHRFNGNDGMGRAVRDAQSASDLAGFGSRAWITGLLDPARISTTNYFFGGTKLKNGKMPKFVKKDVANYAPEQKAELVKVVAAISAEAGLKSQASIDEHDAATMAEGRTLLRDSLKCTDCHQFQTPDNMADAPDLTGYGSREWLTKFLNNPARIRVFTATKMTGCPPSAKNKS